MKNFGKALLAVVLVAGGVVALTRLFTFALKKSSSPRDWETQTTGLSVAVSKWQKLKLARAYSQPKVYILGSSISMHAEIDPRNYKNFNFGFFAASPSLLDWFGREIDAHDSSLPEIIALEFLPHFHTVAAEKYMLDSTALRKASLLTTTTSPWLLQTPWKESSTVVLDWLRGASAPQITVNLLNKHLAVQTPQALNPLPRADFERQNRNYDLRELVPSARSLQTTIETVKRLSSRARCLVLFTPPDNTELWQRSEQGERNRQTMLESLTHATGRKVLSFQGTYRATLFRDATHLNLSDGQKRFNQDLSSVVAEECAKRLK